ncbi:hypothetical protein A6R68_21314, partial [Neotoma lepida]
SLFARWPTLQLILFPQIAAGFRVQPRAKCSGRVWWRLTLLGSSRWAAEPWAGLGHNARVRSGPVSRRRLLRDNLDSPLSQSEVPVERRQRKKQGDEINSSREESNCTTIHTHIADDWLDFAFTCQGSCQDQGGYPCLQVFVNLTHSGQKVLLHYDDEAVRTNPKCFYTPKCHRDRDDLLNSARDIKEFFDHRNGTFTCFYSPDGQLGVVLRKSGHKVVFHCLFWPLLTLLGGALIVGLVRLTQHLSLQCEQYSTSPSDKPREHVSPRSTFLKMHHQTYRFYTTRCQQIPREASLRYGPNWFKSCSGIDQT